MMTQGFPLYAVDRDSGKYAVVGWVYMGQGGISYPVLVPLDVEARGAVAGDSDGGVYRYTTQDPREANPEPRLIDLTDATETEIRAYLREVSARLYQLGATGPARRILEVVEAKPETDLRARLRALADALESHGEHDAARGIRQELNK